MKLVQAIHELTPAVLGVGALAGAAAGSTWPANLALLFLGVQVCRLAVADADLTLMAVSRLEKPRPAFAGKTVWIVGASQGIGQAVAYTLAGLGARLVLSARRKDALEEVAKECRRLGAPDAQVVTMDLRGDSASLQAAAAAAEAAAAKWGSASAGVDFLYLIAGGTQRAAAEDTDPAVDADMFALNTLSLMAVTKAALKGMLKRRSGRIVVVSSMAGKVASPGQAGYAASKHALNGFFHSLRSEVSDRGVGVTVICPGPVATGAPGQPRVTFGATLGSSLLAADKEGKGGAAEGAGAGAPAGKEEKHRMSVPRAAELIVAASAAGLKEAWLARHPVLLVGYLNQYFPSLAATLLDRIGPGRVSAAKSGENMYAAKLTKKGA